MLEQDFVVDIFVQEFDIQLSHPWKEQRIFYMRLCEMGNTLHRVACGIGKLCW